MPPNWKQLVMKIRINSGENLCISPSFQLEGDMNHRIIELEANATLNLTQVNFAENLQEFCYQIYLLGESSTCNLFFLDLAKKSGKLKTTIEVFHMAPNCTSKQLHKGIYADNSLGVLKSCTIINKKASGSDSFQLHRSILLSTQARVLVEPHLKIDTDNIKCKHGVSIGKLDEKILFYLQSRGLNIFEAKKILINSFKEEIFNTIKNLNEQQNIREIVSLWI